MTLVELWYKYIVGYPKEEPPCASCEMLREQLNYANYDRKVLLENVIARAFPRAEKEVDIPEEELIPLRGSRFVPWRVRQQELEKKSRERAGGSPVKTTEELEREVGIHADLQEKDGNRRRQNEESHA